MSTIKKTDLYAHKNPPKAPAKAPEGPLCPLTRQTCLEDACLWWDGDYMCCAAAPVSLYNQIRDAVTDATVEIKNAYGDDRR